MTKLYDKNPLWQNRPQQNPVRQNFLLQTRLRQNISTTKNPTPILPRQNPLYDKKCLWQNAFCNKPLTLRHKTSLRGKRIRS